MSMSVRAKFIEKFTFDRLLVLMLLSYALGKEAVVFWTNGGVLPGG